MLLIPTEDRGLLIICTEWEHKNRELSIMKLAMSRQRLSARDGGGACHQQIESHSEQSVGPTVTVFIATR